MQDDLRWLPMSSEMVFPRGLPWAGGDDQNLWRLPRDAMDRVPDGVRRQARHPAGMRIRLACDSSRLSLRAMSVSGTVEHGLDLYVDGAFWRTVPVEQPEETVLTCFDGCARQVRDITLYLPYRRELRLVAVGVDPEATRHAPKPYSQRLPIVLYGSSIAQGVGASRSGMSYAAVLARAMNVDFVNLGFGGAGKAEPEVVELVSAIDACCFVLDLGKSYGLQPVDAYAAMLDRLRSAHSDAYVVCVAPIFAVREFHDPEYVALSQHTRGVVRRAALDRINGGDRHVLLVEGTDLLGEDDWDGFSSDGVHPNDLGHHLIAERLQDRLAFLCVPPGGRV